MTSHLRTLAWPSRREKDPSYKDRYSNGVATAAFVAGDVPWEWFEKWADTRVHKRDEECEKLKESFKQRLLDLLYLKYQQLKGRVDYVELGTPVDTRTYDGSKLWYTADRCQGEGRRIVVATKYAGAYATGDVSSWTRHCGWICTSSAKRLDVHSCH